MEMRHFELLEDLEPGKSAKAVLLKWSGDHYARSDEKIDVFEFIGKHGDRGDRGYTSLSSESGRWEVVGGLFEQVAGWLSS